MDDAEGGGGEGKSTVHFVEIITPQKEAAIGNLGFRKERE